MAAQADRVIVAKGRKVAELEGGKKKQGKVSSATVDALVGATGNLRAPTVRSGSTLLVGFNEEAFESYFG